MNRCRAKPFFHFLAYQWPIEHHGRSRTIFFVAVIVLVFVTIWWITNTVDDTFHTQIIKELLPSDVFQRNITSLKQVSSSCYNLDKILKGPWSSKKFKFYPVGSQDLFVFSVYGDTRFGDLIRFVGLGIHKKYNLKCLLLQDRKITEIKAEVEYLPEGHRLKYDAVFINCNSALPLTASSFVGLTDGSCSDFHFLPLEIIPRSTNASATSGITLCIPPIHSKFDDVDRIVEFMELNQLLGFKKFVFYDFDIGGNLSQVLNKYVERDLALIIPWNIPVSTGTKYPFPAHYRIHYFGQLVAIHDCLLRVMNRPYKFVAFHDIDEFLLPKKETTLLPFLKLMKDRVAGLSFANAKFDLSYVNTTATRLISMASTKRHAAVLPHGDRSKMIVDASRVAVMGIHFVWKYINGITKRLTANEALLHHYRNWNKAKHLVKDETALRYKEKLTKNFNDFFLKLE